MGTAGATLSLSDDQREAKAYVSVNAVYDILWGEVRYLGIGRYKNVCEGVYEVFPFFLRQSVHRFWCSISEWLEDKAWIDQEC